MNKGEVPAYTQKLFNVRQNKFCVCVFVINEGERIQAQLKTLQPYAQNIDIIIADGGSTDGSLEEGFLKTCQVMALLTKTGPGKLSAQMRMAFDFALKQGYEGVIVVDGNNKDDMSAIPKFIEALEGAYDHVQGSRYIRGGQAINTPLVRHLALKLIHIPLMRCASGFPYTDTTNGFRAYSKRLLTHPEVQVFRDVFQAYELHYYLAIRACRLKLKVAEVPTTRSYPAKGKTPTKISPIKGNILILCTLLKAVFNQFDPKKDGR